MHRVGPIGIGENGVEMEKEKILNRVWGLSYYGVCRSRFGVFCILVLATPFTFLVLIICVSIDIVI